MIMSAISKRLALPRARLMNLSYWPVWGLFAALLIAAPEVFSSRASVFILSQTGAFIIFALSYNMLLGQGGMLSFGHAVYYGLGSFFAAHAMNLAATSGIFIPIELIPLVGGMVGLGFGVLFGFVSTKTTGITFAMVTLGIIELVHSSALIFTGFFGGEGGVSTNRVYGDSIFGVSFGPQIQVYYLIVFWLFVTALAMYVFTQTPLGRIINAVRDNPERAEFVGYDARKVRYLTLILSSFFAGVSGGLMAINFEVVTASSVSLAQSGAVLLFTVIGGTKIFFGPVLGGIVGVIMMTVLPVYTDAWRLYIGVLFIFFVMYAPNGVAGILSIGLRLTKFRKWRRIAISLFFALVTSLIMLAGVLMLVELLYYVALNFSSGPALSLFGLTVYTTFPSLAWVSAVVLSFLGGVTFYFARRPFVRRWQEVSSEIEEEVRERE